MVNVGTRVPEGSPEEALIPSESGAARETFEGVGRRIRKIRKEK